MKLAVGFITYKESSRKYLADFLPSLNQAIQFLSPREVKIYAFDNSDHADSANQEIISAWNATATKDIVTSGFFQAPIIYRSVGQNLGFSRAYNLILEEAAHDQAQYFFMINPDTVLEVSAISRLVEVLEKRDDLASVAPKILRWDFSRQLPTNIIDSLGLVLSGVLEFRDLGQGELDNAKFYHRPIIGPSGAAGLFRLSALDRIKNSSGGVKNGFYFDEQFFMYKEDCDLAYRLFLQGLKSVLVPEAIIYHDRTATSSGYGLLRRLLARRGRGKLVRAWSFCGQQLIFKKYFKMQPLTERFLITFKSLSMFIFSFMFEQYNLKIYFKNLKSQSK